MKRLIFIFTLIFVYIATYATGLEADIIYIDGAKWMLLGKPICSDSVLMKDMIAALPPQRSTSTANWDGYTAYWSIQQEKLCLDSIEYKLYDSETKKYRSESLPQDVLIRVFEKYTDGKNACFAAANEASDCCIAMRAELMSVLRTRAVSMSRCSNGSVKKSRHDSSASDKLSAIILMLLP